MAQANKKIKFVSLISRKDVPLYIQSFDIGTNGFRRSPKTPTNTLNRTFLSHMALCTFGISGLLPVDVNNRRIWRKMGGAILLFIQNDITVYGYKRILS